jgi:hypothetical protein
MVEVLKLCGMDNSRLHRANFCKGAVRTVGFFSGATGG